jgi:restriction system protein
LREHEGKTAAAKARISAHNRSIDSLRQRVLARDPLAVGEYYDRVFADVVDKRPFPRGRRLAYVPDSKLLVIEWQLPTTDVVPKEKEFRYNKATDAIEVSKLRTVEELDETYDELVAQIALRAVNTALAADPDQLLDTVVFNGIALPLNPAEGSGFQSGVCVFSMRAGRRTFAKLKLTDIEPLDRVRKLFAARISDRPDELQAVEPILAYDNADPHAVLQPDSSPLGPDLMTMSLKELEHTTRALLTTMGLDSELVRSSPLGLDFRAVRTTPDGDERLIVHVRRISKPVDQPMVRDLVSSVRREKADEGLLLATAGIGAATFEYANGKPVTLHSRQTLLALLRRSGVRARIEHAPVTAVKPQPARVPMPQPRVPGLPPVRTAR